MIKHDEQNKNETIIEDLNNTEENSEKNQKIFATQLQYVMNRSKKDKGRKRLVLLLLGVSIALTLLSSSFGISFSREQATLVNDIADKEVVVINNTVPQISTRKNADPFLAIESASLVSIDSIDGVEDVCPIYEFSAYGIGMNEIVETASIVVNHQNQYVQEYSFDEMNDATPYTVLPYFSWQNYDSKSIALDDSVVDGIYISESLARKLDMNQLSDTSLQFSACVPMALFKSTVNMESGSYPADFDIITQQTYNFPVKGILDESLTNRYSIMGDNVIYMSYELMHNAMISATKSYVSEDGYIPWSPSAVALNVIDLSLIDSIRGRITNINPNFAVIAPLQDSKNMIQITENVRGAASLIAIIILIIIISSMFVVFLNQTEQRKYEIAMLRANGYRRSEVVTLFLIEALFDALRVSIVAFSFATATNMILLFLFKNQMFDFDVTGFLQTILLDIISISLPTFLSLFRINKYHPDRLMRT